MSKAIALGALLASVVVPITAASGQTRSDEAAKVLDQVTQTYPTTGARLTMTKLRDTRTGRTFMEVRDASGKPADRAAVEAAERSANMTAYGKIDAALASTISTMAAGQRKPVSIWLKAPDPPANRSGSSDARLNAVKEFVSPYRQRVLDALARMGASGRGMQYGPGVFAELTPGQIRSIARHADVDMVYGATTYTLMNDDSATTERANNVWALGNLGAGAASRPVVHEPDGVSDYNSYLNNATHPVIFYCSTVNSQCPQGKNIFLPSNPSGTHASSVAGVVASTHGQVRGIAPSAQTILSANSPDFSDANLVNAFEWARGNGGNPTNMSWGATCPDGQQNFMSRYVDWAVRNLAATFTISSGNTRGCAARDQQVAAPGVAWGAITVGSIEDDNTGFWSGDSVSSFSRWENPDFAPGMEKPEVVAVGQGRKTTSDSGITSTSVNGTSFSAPAVAGQVTQMLARQPGQTDWPETNKATVLTSAFHDVETGQSKDGVGAVAMYHSDRTYRFGRYRNDIGDASAGSFPKSYSVSFSAGQVVRVATAWDAWSTGGGGTDSLGADLDICVVRDDTGATVGCSDSIQNAWEMVEFTAPVTGSYTVRVELFGSDPGWPGTFLGTAWSIRTALDQCSLATTVPSTGATYTNQTNANDGTFFDSYAGWGFGQSGRERMYRLDLSTTKDISITDTHPTMDVHIVRFSACSPWSTTTTVLSNGADVASVNDAPPGTYWMIVDGRDGTVGTTNVTISVTGP